MKRIDRLLVDLGLAESRNQAQELIAAGRVAVFQSGQKRVVTKPSAMFADTSSLRVDVSPSTGPEFVSRGGIKLHGALQKTGLVPKDFLVLDVGISTGGFTDAILQAGAARVIGVDVGHGQLSPKLRQDPRVTLIEGINARDLSSCELFKFTEGRKFDLILLDVSFISQRLVLPEVVPYLKDGHQILALVKPQFEVGREGLGKNGIVKDASLFESVRRSIHELCQTLGLSVEAYFESPIEGSDGNKEFFILARLHVDPERMRQSQDA
ncbi:MAG: TlyA family RNA methyltransferase [Bdellovibrionaceae bacterium]|nr:TlyA family RNA methyltransferase [Pseudobdellovibrionaceae bacterium]